MTHFASFVSTTHADEDHVQKLTLKLSVIATTMSIRGYDNLLLIFMLLLLFSESYFVCTA